MELKPKLSRMLTPYYGEFLTSPVPLELSFNYCSHGCSYCFANLNSPTREGDIRQLQRFLADYRNRDTLEARLLKEGFPVLVSNRVDPFASSNVKQAVPVMRQMTDLGIPLAIQTKGGQMVDDVLDFLPLSVWYVSISFFDDDKRRMVEPGAPSIDSRFALIQKLKDQGHRVVVGINPVVPEWLDGDEAEQLMRDLSTSGVEGVWVEALHLNRMQVMNMTPRERVAIAGGLSEALEQYKGDLDAANYSEIPRDVRARIDETPLGRSQKRHLPDLDQRAYCEAREMVKHYGMEVFSIRQPEPSNFWRPFLEVYEKTFPTLQDFVNYADNNDLTAPEVLAFDEFWGVVGHLLPEGVHQTASYIGAVAHQIQRTHKIPNQLTFEDLCKVIWADTRHKACPALAECFAFAGRRERDGSATELVDESGLPMLVYSREPLDVPYVFVEDEAQPEGKADRGKGNSAHGRQRKQKQAGHEAGGQQGAGDQGV